MPCIIRKRAVEGYYVGASEKLFLGDIFSLDTFHRIRIIGKYLHTESLKYLHHGASDLTCSDNSYCLAPERHSHKAVDAEVEVPCPLVCLVYASVDSHKQCESELGDGCR